jgi:superfamily I DNA and/or RNA helicase
MFSAVICSPEQVSDFYTDFRRINVTVTRAKKKFILVGNQNILAELPLFQDLISRSVTVDLPIHK